MRRCLECVTRFRFSVESTMGASFSHINERMPRVKLWVKHELSYLLIIPCLACKTFVFMGLFRPGQHLFLYSAVSMAVSIFVAWLSQDLDAQVMNALQVLFNALDFLSPQFAIWAYYGSNQEKQNKSYYSDYMAARNSTEWASEAIRRTYYVYAIDAAHYTVRVVLLTLLSVVALITLAIQCTRL